MLSPGSSSLVNTKDQVHSRIIPGMMNLDLSLPNALKYRSRSQQAGTISESWIEREMYCPSCPSNGLHRLPRGTRVVDFKCDRCEEQYQIKSTSKPVCNRVTDSEYYTMMKAIRSDSSPNLMLLHYSNESWRIRNLLLIPRHLIVSSVIKKRKPLRPGARREGWTGCNILLTNIPISGRIFAVRDSVAREPGAVRMEWEGLRFIGGLESQSRRWLVDVLRCIQSMDRERFTLQEVYTRFEEELGVLHPHNRNVRPKIRQQLQVLRDKGFVTFVGRGIYERTGRQTRSD